MRTFFLGAAAIFLAVGVLLGIGMIPPNQFVGIRTARTLSDPALWYAANRAFGLVAIPVALASGVATIIVYRTNLSEPVKRTRVGLVFIAGLMVATAAGLSG